MERGSLPSAKNPTPAFGLNPHSLSPPDLKLRPFGLCPGRRDFALEMSEPLKNFSMLAALRCIPILIIVHQPAEIEPTAAAAVAATSEDGVVVSPCAAAIDPRCSATRET